MNVCLRFKGSMSSVSMSIILSTEEEDDVLSVGGRRSCDKNGGGELDTVNPHKRG